MRNLILAGFVALHMTACGGASAPTVSENDTTGESPELVVKIVESTDDFNYQVENGNPVSQKWEIDGVLESEEVELKKPSLTPGKHSIKLTVSDGDREAFDRKSFIVDDEPRVEIPNITAQVFLVDFDLDPTRIKSASFYSMNRAGNILASESNLTSSFVREGRETFLLIDGDGSKIGFYSNLSIELTDGSFLGFFLQDNEWKRSLITIKLTSSEVTVDEMSGLHSLSFSANTSEMIDFERVKSFTSVLDTEFGSYLVDSGYNHFDDETVYEWSEDGLKMKSFALGYGDPKIIRTAICIELESQAAPRLVCSNLH